MKPAARSSGRPPEALPPLCCAWLDPAGAPGPIISCRIRLARNLRAHPFPGRLPAAERHALWERLAAVCRQAPLLAPVILHPLEKMEAWQRQLLCERQLISRELTAHGEGCGLAARADETLSVLVNEEDHLRLQAMRPGAALREAWADALALDDALARQVEYAFSERWGYLTACTTNVGTGLRAGVMLHLPGLMITGEMAACTKALNQMGFAVRGSWGEGSELRGHLAQVSNQVTLGVSEEDLLARLERMAADLAGIELNARRRLLERKAPLLRDQVARALGVARHAELLPSGEALDVLSCLRLGIETGMLTGLNLGDLNEWMVRVQPGHLQQLVGAPLGGPQRDQMRAALFRDCLGGARLKKAAGRL